MITDLDIAAPLGKSDHSTIEFTFKCYMEKEPPILKTMYHKGDYTKLSKKLMETDWKSIMSKFPEDVNKQWATFKQIFSEAEKLYIPKKLVYINGNLSRKFTIPLDRQNLQNLNEKIRYGEGSGRILPQKRRHFITIESEIK